MSVTMYNLTVPVFSRGLTVLSTLLTKAEAHAAETGVSVESLVSARLVEDMLPLSGQIQRVSDTAKNTVGRLMTIAAPSFPDTEATFAELKARVEKTLAFLQTITAQDLEGSDTRDISVKFGKLELTLSGSDYVLKFAIPNFFFHVTTAYDILRAQGVPVGKADYLGAYS
ncbi:DUF1993 domain-containing protein [Pararhizobium antarcticum]|uniref:DUF1993 domain-containing protein n=1 Tax=Pararhizobium antarcticum TaxID=1798805 RepID=A0A657LTH8_9HYPH|nr:DUF1993 domain-containing protein [Pararhizobium antarcticum]OJF92977.1 hypothetical protein AX761_20440 [Rhizobium sp. 58]OJF96848.1 hypothetical protein AX760_03010 [Pararhizobium antarcticum]